jgi:hypothetical protein
MGHPDSTVDGSLQRLKGGLKPSRRCAAQGTSFEREWPADPGA